MSVLYRFFIGTLYGRGVLAADPQRALLRLNLPPAELLFLLRIRFGLYAVLEQLGARCDWAALEAELTASGPARTRSDAG